jgi:hypothetical protein
MDQNKLKAENFWLRAGIVFLCVCALSMASVWNRTEEMNKELVSKQTHQIDSLKNITDSLHDDLFNEKVENGRHELTRDEIFKRHKGLEKEYNQYLEHETE